MILYKQFNIINEIETLIFTLFLKNFLLLKYFLKTIELPNILEFFKCIFFER